MHICPKVVGNILMWQTLLTDAPREIGTTCLCSAACGYQNAASQLPCWRDACRKLSTWAHLPCIHVLGCPLRPPDNARNNLPYPRIKRTPIQGPERAA